MSGKRRSKTFQQQEPISIGSWLLALITIMAVKLQMFGAETCHVHVKIDRSGHGNNRQKQPSQHAREL